MDKISVVINTYNAHQHLARVLDTVRDFDEVVVCDMESTDDTRDIAARYGCRIVTFPKNGHTIVEPARNFAVQSATHPWVLVVDADELVTPELHDLLYREIQRPDCPAGFFIPRKNLFLGMFVRDFHPDYILRFLRREGSDWPPTIHSIPTVAGRVERLPAKGEAHIVHLADETVRQWVTKMNKYTDNEVDKKASRHFGIAALLFRPAWRFFQSYVLKGGFLNGRRGLIEAHQWAIYQQVMVMKIIERRLRQHDS